MPINNNIKKENLGRSQDLVSIEKIENDIIYLKDNSLCKIIMVNGTNFELKSENEQEIILENFKNFLNSLDFPIQILIHSRKTNTENYIEFLKLKYQEEKNELLKIQIFDYINFIKTFVENNNIITKKFFVIVKYSPTIFNNSRNSKEIFNIFNIFNKKQENYKTDQQFINQQNIENLEQRVIKIIDGLEQIGLNTIILEQESLVELFYNLYNPSLQK